MIKDLLNIRITVTYPEKDMKVYFVRGITRDQYNGITKALIDEEGILICGINCNLSIPEPVVRNAVVSLEIADN